MRSERTFTLQRLVCRITDARPIDLIVHLDAHTTNGHQKCVHIGHNLIHLTIIKYCAQTTGKAFDACSSAVGAGATDGLRRVLDHIGGKADRTRKFGIQQQELGNILRTNTGSIHFTVRLERRATLQQFATVQKIRSSLAEWHIGSLGSES
jgi:hypothetical protein